MLKFFPLLIPKGGSFSGIFQAPASKLPESLVKDFATLFGKTSLRGLNSSDTLSKIEFLNNEFSSSERSQLAPFRREHILKLMKEMPETISNWKRDRKILKDTSKPRYPF